MFRYPAVTFRELLMHHEITTAAQAEGFAAYRQSPPIVCPYPDAIQREQWAAGFDLACREDRGSKAWYKSTTLLVGSGMILLAVGMISYGMEYGTSLSLAAAGGVLTIRELVGIGLRLMTNQPIELPDRHDDRH
jgi:hypothetical protein